jgi:hypothetical protein
LNICREVAVSPPYFPIRLCWDKQRTAFGDKDRAF